MRIKVPMCGSTASYSRGCAAVVYPESRTQAAKLRAPALLIIFHTAVPVAVQLIYPGHFHRTHQAETEPLGIGLVPDAFGQLRILLLPVGVGSHAGGAAQHVRRVVPGTAPHGMRIGLRGLDPGIRFGSRFVRRILVERPL